MERMRKYSELNLDLSHRITAAMNRKNLSCSVLAGEIGLEEYWIQLTIENPVAVPCCYLAIVLKHLDLQNEYYEAMFNQIERERNDSELTIH